MDSDKPTEYYRTVYKPKWDKWHGKVTDLEKKLEEELFKELEREKKTPKTEESKTSA